MLLTGQRREKSAVTLPRRATLANRTTPQDLRHVPATHRVSESSRERRAAAAANAPGAINGGYYWPLKKTFGFHFAAARSYSISR